VEKLTGGFDNGLGAILIGVHSLASFLSKRLPEGFSGLFQHYRSDSDDPACRQLSPKAAMADLFQAVLWTYVRTNIPNSRLGRRSGYLVTSADRVSRRLLTPIHFTMSAADRRRSK
jgi:hypothetical protein